MRFCPFVQRVKLVLSAKNIQYDRRALLRVNYFTVSVFHRYEEVLIHLSDAPDWYLAKNPVGEVPLLEWIHSQTNEVRSIPESLVVSDYLDAIYPDNRLHPADPLAKAQQQVLVSRYGNVKLNASCRTDSSNERLLIGSLGVLRLHLRWKEGGQ
jgi:glutathione S-transferase